MLLKYNIDISNFVIADLVSLLYDRGRRVVQFEPSRFLKLLLLFFPIRRHRRMVEVMLS